MTEGRAESNKRNVSPAMIARIAGTISQYPDGAPVYAADLARRADVSIVAATYAVKHLIDDAMLSEGDLMRRTGIVGQPPRQLHPTPRFFEELGQNQSWRAAALTYELVQTTGFSEEEVIVNALLEYRDRIAAQEPQDRNDGGPQIG